MEKRKRDTQWGMLLEHTKERLGEKAFSQDYVRACRILEKRLLDMNEKAYAQLGRELISSVEWRVKTPESCVNKLLRKGKRPTLENARERLNDIAGVRVVCSFLDDIYQLCRRMAYDYEFEFVKQKDYVKHPKSSGYQSLHLIVRVPVGESRKVRAEIQFRTQAMDFWACVEHHFVYKGTGEHGKRVEKELRKCARSIYRIDRKMMSIRNKMEEENALSL